MHGIPPIELQAIIPVPNYRMSAMNSSPHVSLGMGKFYCSPALNSRNPFPRPFLGRGKIQVFIEEDLKGQEPEQKGNDEDPIHLDAHREQNNTDLQLEWISKFSIPYIDTLVPQCGWSFEQSRIHPQSGGFIGRTRVAIRRVQRETGVVVNLTMVIR